MVLEDIESILIRSQYDTRQTVTRYGLACGVLSTYLLYPCSTRGGYTVLPLSVQDIFRRIFLSNYWWQKSDIWSQASYRYAILLEAFLDPSDSYFLFADLVGFYTHWTYMQGYHKWASAHSSSCFFVHLKNLIWFLCLFTMLCNCNQFYTKQVIFIRRIQIFVVFVSTTKGIYNRRIKLISNNFVKKNKLCWFSSKYLWKKNSVMALSPID